MSPVVVVRRNVTMTLVARTFQGDAPYAYGEFLFSVLADFLISIKRR